MNREGLPEQALAEQLTTENLLTSLRGERCPSCGEEKFRKQTLCGQCYRRLPGRLKGALYRLIDDGYDAAVLEAMKHLGRTHFIMPGETVHEITQLGALANLLSPTVCQKSLASKVCPKCAGRKLTGQCLCRDCRKALIAASCDSTLFAREAAALAESLHPSLLQADPARYSQVMADAICTLKGKTFHFPKE